MNKKVYVKPDAMLVDFSLSSSIAAACKFIGTSTNANTCGYTEEGSDLILFAPGNVCNIPVIDQEFCYHAPTEANSVFAS